MAHEVFICHASEDKEVAEAACVRLERAGIRCWIAPRDPVPGVPYASQLVDAIAASRLVLLVFSEHTNRSEHVLRELEVASEGQKVILPLRIAESAPSGELRYYITRLHWFDATVPPIEDRLGELVARIAGLLGKEVSPAPVAISDEALQGNLPPPLTSFVGRDADVAAIASLLRRGRIVTITGFGGMGKTRCAIEAARRLSPDFTDGVWFVDLSTLRDPSEIPSAVATAIKAPASEGAAIENMVLSYLRKQHSLLILDNCEQVIDAARSFVLQLVQTCESVVVLTTSREAFNVYGEQLYRLPPLKLDGSVALFAERAAASDARFALSDENSGFVAEICRKLDGIPLAIELAAARVRMVTPQQLAGRIRKSIEALGARRDSSRHHTLRATFDWSYDLLTENERALFRRLAIFAGTFALETAVSICGDVRLQAIEIVETFESLVDKSLVQPETISGDVCYRLLEPLRECAYEKLEACGERTEFSRAHANEYAKIAEESYRDWGSLADDLWVPKASSDLGNFRSALKWAFDGGGDVLPGQRIAGAIRSIWIRFDPNEGCRRIAHALERVTQETPLEVVARLELARAHLGLMLADYRAALPAARHALLLFTSLNDALGVAESQLFTGAASGLSGNLEEGKDLLQLALSAFRSLEADRQIGSTLQYLALMHISAGNTGTARPLFAEALQIFRALPGADRSARHMAAALAELEFQSGDATAALALAREALDKDRASNEDALVVFDLCNICAYLIALNRFEEAADAASVVLPLARRLGVELGVTVAFQHIAALATLREEASEHREATNEAAAQLLGFVDARMTAAQSRRDYTEQQEYERTRERLATELGSDQFTVASLEGAKWTESEAAAAASRIGSARPSGANLLWS